MAGDLTEYTQADRNTRVLQRALHSRAVLVVVDFDRDREQALGATKAMLQMFRSHAAIVGIGSSTDAGSVLEAMRAGCVDFLPKPLGFEQVAESLARLEVRWAPEEQFQQNRGQVLVLLGTKGGVGTTTLAVHLGTFLARTQGKKTLLIDHHQQLGHVCLYLGMDANYYSFQEMVKSVDRLDLSLLNSFVAHHASGLDVLASPDTFNLAATTQAEDEVQTLEFLRSQYDFVLLDCSLGLTEANLALMEHSDEFYLVSTPDVAALRDLSRYVDRLLQTSHFEGKIQVAINRYSSESAVSMEQIQTAVRLPIAVTVPNDYFKLLQAINEGRPISPERNTELVRQFRKWAGRLCTVPAPAQPAGSKRFFRFWK
jgi:pilus assembly protein CpaE